MDPSTQNALAKHFASLHVPGNPVVLGNVYDGATARLVCAHPAARAVATASYAVAATYGVDDDDMTLQQNLEGIKKVAEVVKKAGLPLTCDLQDGYEDIQATVKHAIALGAVGCNIEDVDCRARELREVEDAVARIKMAKAAAAEAGVPDFVVNARTDALAFGKSVEEAVRRGKSYLEAGATTIYVWGGGSGRGVSSQEIKVLVDAFGGMLNVKMNLRPGFLTVEEIKRLGVARISVGPELYSAAMKGYKEALRNVLG